MRKLTKGQGQRVIFLGAPDTPIIPQKGVQKHWASWALRFPSFFIWQAWEISFIMEGINTLLNLGPSICKIFLETLVFQHLNILNLKAYLLFGGRKPQFYGKINFVERNPWSQLAKMQATQNEHPGSLSATVSVAPQVL